MAGHLDAEGRFTEADNLTQIIRCAYEGILKELIKEKVMPEGYIIRTEKWSNNPEDPPVEMTSAYTPNGDYIGDPKMAKQIFEKGIVPQISQKGNQVCTIGFSGKGKGWYGWSHRAIACFKIGDKVKEGDSILGAMDKYRLPVGFEAKTLDDCKKMAIAFAESVS